MIYDCITFFNELDLLEFRLRILDDVVDRFVVCEAPFTFRGKPKALYAAQAMQRFARWRERLIWLTYPGPASTDPWRNEWGQRDYIATALRDCAADDLVLIGDCDEIPDPRNVARRPSAPGGIIGHVERLSAGYLNRVSAAHWINTRTIRAGDIARYGTISAIRQKPTSELEEVDGGWHFTSLGGATIMEEKMQSYSHSEYDCPYYRDRYRLEVTFESATEEFQWMPLDGSFPEMLHEARWAHYVWPQPAALTESETQALEHAHGCLAYVPADAAVVVAVAPDAPQAWETAGRQRFGERFRGVAADAGAVAAALDARCWVVIDGLEREAQRNLVALRTSGAGVVAFAHNARSFSVLDDVLRGAGFPAGRALGAEELQAWIGELGWRDVAIDRIATHGVYAVFAHMPEQMFGVDVGPFRFPALERETLKTFLARAFVFTFAPASVSG
jgi:beta-1,4-mannosyl-glycoprotein beta-1,4-N-acetylglucosaminyltransferase